MFQKAPQWVADKGESAYNRAVNESAPDAEFAPPAGTSTSTPNEGQCQP